MCITSLFNRAGSFCFSASRMRATSLRGFNPEKRQETREPYNAIR